MKQQERGGRLDFKNIKLKIKHVFLTDVHTCQTTTVLTDGLTVFQNMKNVTLPNNLFQID